MRIVKILTHDVQQQIHIVFGVGSILYANSRKQRLKSLQIRGDRECKTTELLRCPIQLIGSNERLLTLNVNAARVLESLNFGVRILRTLIQYLVRKYVRINIAFGTVQKMFDNEISLWLGFNAKFDEEFLLKPV